MTNTTITDAGGRTLVLSAFAGELLTVFYDMRWMIVAVLILVVADFWFGIRASLQRGAEFRFSRAGRRTCAKFIDYVNYLILGSVLGMAIFEPLSLAGHTEVAAAALALGCVWEVDSIVGHVCEIHGVKKRLSVKRLLIRLLKKRLDS